MTKDWARNPAAPEFVQEFQRFPMGRRRDTMPYTWWLNKDDPAVDIITKETGADDLKDLADDLGIYLFQNRDGEDTVFACRFEFPKYGKDFKYSEAVTAPAYGFVDFLGGIPLECVEMLVLICQGDKKGDFDVKDGTGKPAAPCPRPFFKGAPADRILLNFLYLHPKHVKLMASNLGGEPKPKLHWWLRTRFLKDQDTPPKYPTPGQFMALGVRMMPDEPWGTGAGKQKSSPFIFSGNWADTVFYTGAKVISIEDPTDERPFPLYTVSWRGKEYKVCPSDFSEYQVGDKVAILKDVAADKDSQLWKDDDMKNFGGDQSNWQIVPVLFYDKEAENGGN